MPCELSVCGYFLISITLIPLVPILIGFALACILPLVCKALCQPQGGYPCMDKHSCSCYLAVIIVILILIPVALSISILVMAILVVFVAPYVITILLMYIVSVIHTVVTL